MEKSNAQKTFGTLRGKRILIVDDEQLNQLVIKNMVKLWGAECETVDNGNLALKKIQENNYDIILMDLMMPVLDGYQTSAKIRKEIGEPANNTPILALTGTSSNASLDKIKEAGINDYASKPFKIEELHEKVSALIKGIEINEERQSSTSEQIINLDYLKESTSNNQQLIKEIIGIFLDQTPGYLARIDSAARLENWDEVRTVAHKMKPTVSYVGIASIENIIREIENYSEGKVHLEEIPGLVKDLKIKCEAAFVELKNELSGIQ